MHWIHLWTGKLVSVWNTLCLVLFKLTFLHYPPWCYHIEKNINIYYCHNFVNDGTYHWCYANSHDAQLLQLYMSHSFVNMLLFFHIVLRLSLKMCAISLFIRFMTILKARVYLSDVSTSDQQPLIATGNSTEMVLAGGWLNMYGRIWVYCEWCLLCCVEIIQKCTCNILIPMTSVYRRLLV